MIHECLATLQPGQNYQRPPSVTNAALNWKRLKQKPLTHKSQTTENEIPQLEQVLGTMQELLEHLSHMRPSIAMDHKEARDHSTCTCFTPVSCPI